MTQAHTIPRVAAPSRLLQLLELRAAWELAVGVAALPWLRLAPRGDGHPVLVLPGWSRAMSPPGYCATS